jgi:Bacterial archaeo-eukaryotic release factor family 10
MTPPIVGNGTLRRLRELTSGAESVLSVYLDLDGGRGPAPATPQEQLRSLTSDIGPGNADVARVRDALLFLEGLVYGAQSLAAFSAGDGSAFELLALPAHVEPMAILDAFPWLEPLAGMFTSGECGVAILGAHTTRLFRGDQRALVEFAAEPNRLSLLGDCSQPHAQHPTVECVSEQVRRLSALLERADRRRAFEHLIVVAPTELWPSVEDSLRNDLRERLAGCLELGLESAAVPDIARALAPVLKRVACERTERCACSTITTPRAAGRRITAHETTTRELRRLPRAQRTRVPACDGGAR